MLTRVLSSALFVGALAVNTFACTNVLVTDGVYASVARTMDFAVNMGDKMGYGAVGAANVSNVNLKQSSEANPVAWSNKYAYIGQTGFKTYVVLDGINAAGVYAGFLYLPGITKYPEYNPNDKRPELGVLDSINYVLGTSANVEEAMENLKNVQFTPNTVPLNIGGGKIAYLCFPLHLIIRDKHGSSLLVEWIDGKVKTYYHKANSNDTIEATNFENQVTHAGFNMSTVTNAPEYSWQINNVKKYDKLFNGNSDEKVDGLYMNGSGYFGMPGDYTPPSRFVRAYVISKFMPKANNQNETDASAYGLLASVTMPIGVSSDTTLWASVSNLRDNVYYWKPLMNMTLKKGVTKVAPFAINSPKVIRFDLNQLKNALGVPRGFINASVNKTATLTQEQTTKAYEFLQNTNTKGLTKTNMIYEPNLAEFNGAEFDVDSANSGVAFP